jgi:hypothetical protein
MRRFMILSLLLVGVIFFPVTAKADSYSTFVANAGYSAQAYDQSYGYPADPIAFSGTSITTENASTTSVAVTNLAGRKKIVFVPNATGDLWVSVGTTTAVVNGTSSMKVAYGDEMTLEVDANVALGTIASTAFQYTKIQFGRNQGQK